MQLRIAAAKAAEAAMMKAFTECDKDGTQLLPVYRAFKAVQQLGIKCEIDDVLQLVRRPALADDEELQEWTVGNKLV